MARNLSFCFTKIKSPPSSQANLSRPFSTHVNNFNCLYQTTTNHNVYDSDDDETASASASAAPDLATAFASRRFFFASPGRSNSIIDSSSASTSTSSLNHHAENDAAVVSSGSVAVPTYSPDPYLDFRRSMEEMVEARRIHDVREDWDDLHQLLMCYLSINPKSAHKFIIGAFADLLVSLMTASHRKTPIRDGERKISR
ncbi:transcription repressor OFP16-like [Andrographis paniculata]|uniref:transcription repressor OFP16-like n=1 Tax=Andrographis paniculata TaxID=175694 RepID=UPI0021E7C33D|nr:transcription repressor OFP16-like [Andrographis paniculata]